MTEKSLATRPVISGAPVLKHGSYLARGLTFSVRELEGGGGYRLLIWRNREPIVDEEHPDASAVMKRGAQLLAEGTLGGLATSFVRSLFNPDGEA